MRVGNAALSALSVVALSAAGCSNEAETRPQLVVEIDTTAPVVGQLLAQPELPLTGAIDTLRIDVLDGAPHETQLLVAPDATNWPVSFGIASEGITTPVLLRIRAFQSRLAEPDAFAEGSEPLPDASIDRIVELRPPRSGLETVRVTLDMGCFGVRPNLLERTTCIDWDQRTVAFDQGIEKVGGRTPSRVGTSPIVRPVECQLPGPTDAVCIKGGFSLMGDPIGVGLSAEVFVDPFPRRPVVVSPFWMDRNEVTVARYRTLVDGGLVAAPQGGDFCTWNAGDEALPVNCVTEEQARAACAAWGGSLPSEAQWEHAARGRGQGYRFVWGDAPFDCCASAVARITTLCPGTGTAPIGSHTDASQCNGRADVTADGVIDLNGNVSEFTTDRNRPYEHPCWGPLGVSLNPSCDDSTAQVVTRGGNWGSGLLAALLTTRGWRISNRAIGFRCVYPGAAP
ncbi:MAG: SUMF1/EgtB/PvdO family nonheme iron enzyme [Polyangiaceae bacterium]